MNIGMCFEIKIQPSNNSQDVDMEGYFRRATSQNPKSEPMEPPAPSTNALMFHCPTPKMLISVGAFVCPIRMNFCM